MRLSLMPMQFGAHIPALSAASVDEMKLLVDRAIKGVRNIATVLRPEALILGLVPAIEWLRDEFLRNSEVRCGSNASEIPIRLMMTRVPC
jgi:signal transduction histidine kinase